ncbi:MAG: DNA-3-methyladenine glycosylase I [Pyrinomonadaceae bacterium]|nr:DNA-3-methyladenine glycosylase I [Pyrinomonadaceae bacterium]MCX7640094.1 DNA-3-methyladenine glycosylase I [Pyrinomonadaceae bacterium]MDW8304266.1 DNA-3-methyladenine glycosylase I [Acidobacteriota bacterium]
MSRCEWAKSCLEIEYHDQEWGVPCRDDRKLFEFLVLETMQTGISWAIILKKREALRSALDGFKPEVIASYNQEKISSLLENKNIIKNKAKIEATVLNAKAFLKVQDRFGSFADYVWRFVDGKPIKNSWQRHTEIPQQTSVSQRMSKIMQQDGFAFVGPVVCYSFMQACGIVNDHLISCFRYDEINLKEQNI